jgi:rRNA-processing protein FCF1
MGAYSATPSYVGPNSFAPAYAPSANKPIATAPQQTFPTHYGAPAPSLPMVATSQASHLKFKPGTEGKGGPKGASSAPNKHTNSTHSKTGNQTGGGGGGSNVTKYEAGASALTLVTEAGPIVTKEALNFRIQKWLDLRKGMAALWQVTTVILDTNVLLDSAPDVVLGLHEYSASLKFIVPFVLIQELDSLKSRSYGPNIAARHAISALFENLVLGSKKDKWIRGQKQGEFVPLEGTLKTTSGDDRILECANYFHRYSPEGKRAMLLTHDKNLTLKATLCGIQTGTVSQLKHFLETFNWLAKERETLQRLLALNPQDSPSSTPPDFRLEDYTPDDDDEDDEFEKVKAAKDKVAQAEKQKKSDTEKRAQLDAQVAETRAILPSGTRTNIYDESSDEEKPSIPKQDHPSAFGSTSSPSATSTAVDEASGKKKKKNRKNKHKNAKKRQREEGNETSDSEVSLSEPAAKKKSKAPISSSMKTEQETPSSSHPPSSNPTPKGSNSPIVLSDED